MKKYNIGLDIGTESVGWAVVERENNKIIRKGNKKLWGVRLFEKAESAQERRLARNTRRRYDRRRKRIKLLQEEFKIEIKKIDPNFYLKMKESFFNKNDDFNKTIKISKNENDLIKKYYKKYPTIYHLRKELINSDAKIDIRLVYLAIHHIIKYRGNFLYSNENFCVSDFNIKEKLKTIFNNIYNIDESIDSYLIDYDKLEEALKSSSKNDRKQLINEQLKDYIKDSSLKEFCKLLIGNKFSISKLLDIEVEEDIKISFKGTDYEDKYDILEKTLDDKIEIIETLKELYDMIFLTDLFKGSKHNTISSLMVERYNKHKEDLTYLKKIIKIDEEQYKKTFKSKKIVEKSKDLCIYEKYVKNYLTYEEFIKEINKSLEIIFKKIGNNELYNDYIINKKTDIDNGVFLPRITDVDNGKYPYQLNKEELKQIIEKQGNFYPFLKEEINIDNKKTYKIIKLLEFRIPYYVGPLNTTTTKELINNKNAWLIKKANEIITPYNFNEVVDLEASAELFITRMLSHCTYILEESAIPNNSILYSKFKVMNELKQIKVNDKILGTDFINRIYNELFLTNGTINNQKFYDYLYQTGEFDMDKELIINGYSSDKKFANNMQSYVDFFGENGIFKDTNYTLSDAEKIIRWITIFEDKKILEKKIINEYNLSNEIIRKIISKKYKGWSNLSEKLLITKYYEDKTTNTKKSIIDIMEETNKNFMQIITDKEYKFQKMIDEFNKIDKNKKLNYDVINSLATSPATKRGIYQALKIVEEIIDYMKYEPDNIVIEMARGEEEKKRTNTKKAYLLKIYESCKSTIKDYEKLNKELRKFDKIDSQKLFLYFIQEGKSLYSGESLNIDDLESYEIDHIIPQTLIKDDSIDNKALVLREENQIKRASLIVPQEFRTYEIKKWWNHLKEKKLISSKKYYNLCRDQYKETDIEGFINRQLVETRQITKHVANILKSYHEKTNIVYLNANLSHNYRQKYELYKFRDLNDYHHAHDAYLTSVLGEYKTKWLKKTNFEDLKELSKKYIKNKEYSKLKYGYVINSIETNSIIYDENTGEILFDANTFNKTIENTIYQNDITISKKTEIKSGEFYNQTKSKKGNKGVNLKDNLPSDIYGSYTSINAAYAVVIKYIIKGKEQQKMIGIPIYIDVKNNLENNLKNNYIKKSLKLTENDNFEIVKDRIPFYSILDWNGQICSLVGATNTIEVCNAKEFFIDREHMKKWKDSLNQLLNKKDNIDKFYENNIEEIIIYILDKIKNEYKLYENLLPNMILYFGKDKINELNLEQKENIIIELLKLLKFNSMNANLKFLDTSYSGAFGKKNDRIIKHAKIISRSITGIMENENEF